MASLMKSLIKSSSHFSSSSSSSSSFTSSQLKSTISICCRSYARVSAKEKEQKEKEKEKEEKEKEKEKEKEERVVTIPEAEPDVSDIPTSGISRPLSEILKELNKRVPDELVKNRSENGFSMKYVPWHIVNRIMNLHAPEWSGEVRDITYSSDGKSVSVVYRVTVYGTDAEIYRESTGTASVDDTKYGDPVQKAESMAFRRACARLGLGLHLYHDDV